MKIFIYYPLKRGGFKPKFLGKLLSVKYSFFVLDLIVTFR